MKRVTKPICWLKFFVTSHFGPRIRTEGSIVVQKEEVTRWCHTVWNYFSLFHPGQIKCRTCSAWFFFLKNNFLYLMIRHYRYNQRQWLRYTLNVYICIYIFTTQECCEQYWTRPGGNTPQDTNYTATCLPSRKLSKLNEPNMQDTAGEAGTSS